MKTRPIKELLIIVRDNLDEYMRNSFNPGLCGAIWSFKIAKLFSDSEYKLTKRYLEKNRPSNYYKRHDGYWWTPKSLLPRINWLNKQINKL